MDGLLTQCAPFLTGGGRIEATPSGTRLILPPTSSARYSDAQLDDYSGLPRRNFPHRPPLRLSLRARFSHDITVSHTATASTEKVYSTLRSPRLRGSLRGTAGFGFWNNPFGPQSKVPALPQAIWFFYASPPSNMSLALDVPGCGWKVACIDAGRPSALAWSPIAPLVMLACHWPQAYRALWPRVQRALGISESPLAFKEGAMADWHTYELEWQRDGARWWVDGEVVLDTDRPPRGPLGFVAWIDNQYAVVTPKGTFRFGLLDTPFEQWLEMAEVNVASDT